MPPSFRGPGWRESPQVVKKLTKAIHDRDHEARETMKGITRQVEGANAGERWKDGLWKQGTRGVKLRTVWEVSAGSSIAIIIIIKYTSIYLHKAGNNKQTDDNRE